MTQVMNLATGQIAVYDLPPREAVRNAYLQLTRGDYRWWDYDKNYPNLKVIEGQDTVSCGDWAAFKDGRPFIPGA